MTTEEIDQAENLWYSMKRFAIHEDDQQRTVKAIFAAARKGVELEEAIRSALENLDTSEAPRAIRILSAALAAKGKA